MIQDTITRIREHLQKPGVRKGAFALAAGLHPNTLIGIDDPNWNPTAETLLKLEAALPSEDEPELAKAS